MSVIIGLPKKDLERVNKELLELHKRVITNYLLSCSLKLPYRKKFFIVYDFYINYKNIHEYFFTPIKVFVTLLIRNELHKIQNYSHKDVKPKKRKKR